MVWLIKSMDYNMIKVFRKKESAINFLIVSGYKRRDEANDDSWIPTNIDDGETDGTDITEWDCELIKTKIY